MSGEDILLDTISTGWLNIVSDRSHKKDLAVWQESFRKDFRILSKMTYGLEFRNLCHSKNFQVHGRQFRNISKFLNPYGKASNDQECRKFN
jgi:hypothetical protein